MIRLAGEVIDERGLGIVPHDHTGEVTRSASTASSERVSPAALAIE